MMVHPWTFLFEIINFTVLVFVLRWLLYRPLREAIVRRQRENEQARAEAERAAQEAAALKQQLVARLTEAEQRGQELIRQACEQADAERKQRLAEADRVAQHRRAEFEKQIEAERADALQALYAELIESAIALAERLLREASDTTLHTRLAERLVLELDRLPDDERRRLRKAWAGADSALVESAGTLEDGVLDRLTAALQAVLGGPVRLTIRDRPDLLGGVRLRLGGDVFDATLARQLDEVRSSRLEARRS